MASEAEPPLLLLPKTKDGHSAPEQLLTCPRALYLPVAMKSAGNSGYTNGKPS
jgi:hypothetical protein